MEIINLTPHGINLIAADGTSTTYPPSGVVARVEETPGRAWRNSAYPLPVRSATIYGDLTGLPPRTPAPTVDELAGPHGPPDKVFIVSLVVAQKLRNDVEAAAREPFPGHGKEWYAAMMRRFIRDDVVSPGELVRDASGRIIGCRDFVAVFGG